MKQLNEETLERIGKVYKRSVEMSPIRTPNHEKSLGELISFAGFRAEGVSDPDLKEAMSLKSETLIKGNILREIVDSNNIINEKNNITDAIKILQDKMSSLEGQIQSLTTEKKELSEIVDILHHYDHLLVTVK